MIARVLGVMRQLPSGCRRLPQVLWFLGGVKLRVPLGNQRNFSGVLEGLEDADGTESVRLRVDETQHRFALDNIDRARLVPKF